VLLNLCPCPDLTILLSYVGLARLLVQARDVDFVSFAWIADPLCVQLFQVSFPVLACWPVYSAILQCIVGHIFPDCLRRYGLFDLRTVALRLDAPPNEAEVLS